MSTGPSFFEKGVINLLFCHIFPFDAFLCKKFVASFPAFFNRMDKCFADLLFLL
jgi:hypothetical protein